MSGGTGNGHSPEAIAKAVRLIVGVGHVTELRALDAVVTDERWPHTVSGYFDDPDKLAEAVGAIKSAKGIYFVPNPVNPALLARANNRIRKAAKGESTQDIDVMHRHWLLVDVDAQRPSGISATDAEHEAAIERARTIYGHLKREGWPDPIAADSGNGAHLLYRIDLPTDDGGLVQRCLAALARRFDADGVSVDQTVFNPARIWKLYGTVARKGDDTPERPHRMAKVLNKPETLEPVPLSKLETLAGEAQSTHEPTARAASRGSGQPFDIESFIARHGLDATDPEPWNGQQGQGRRWVLNIDPMAGVHNDGSCFIIEHANGAISAGSHHNSATWNWRDLRKKYEPTHPTRSTPSVGNQPQKDGLVVEQFRQFPVDVLPEPVRSFVNVGAKAIGCDPSFIALPLLAALAAAIGNTRRIQLKRGWTEPAIIWAATVGESGTAKTPAFKLAIRPVHDRQGKALKRHAEALAEYEMADAHYEKDMATWRRGKGTGIDPPTKPDRPEAERFAVSDTTVEAIAPLLLANPRGLLLARDELAGWMGSFDRYASGKTGADAAHWLSMHNGESIVVDRKTGRTRTIYVPLASVSVTGGIQPGILHRALGIEHRESGLAARLLLAFPPRRPKRWTEAEIGPETEASIASLLDKLYCLESDVNDDDDPVPMIVRLSAAGKREWVAFYNAHAMEQDGLTGDLSAAWSKLEGYAARLALVVHLVRCAAGDSPPDNPDAVDEQSISAGVTLSQWFGQEARRVYAVLGESDEERDQRRLVELIQRKGGSVTPRQVMRTSRMFRTTDGAEEALDELASAGIGRWECVPTTANGGRPTRQLRLVDAVDVDKTPTNPEEQVGCVNVNATSEIETELVAEDPPADHVDKDEGAQVPECREDDPPSRNLDPGRPGPIDLLTAEQRERYMAIYHSRSASMSPEEKHRCAWRAATTRQENKN